jgi:hypothetical protein
MLRLAAFGLALAMTVSCGSQPSFDSTVTQKDPNANPLTEKFGVRVNLTTNMATFYEDGQPIRQWKVATARYDGKSITPPGKYRFHELTTCVRWTSTRNNSSAGPCAPDNPLGYRALWFFTSEYGMHGVDAAHLDSVTAQSAEGRRQSSGCIRNHPDDIAWMTDKVAHLYGTTPAQLAIDIAKKAREKSYKPIGRGLALEVGRWKTDPEVSKSAQPVKNPAQPVK